MIFRRLKHLKQLDKFRRQIKSIIYILIDGMILILPTKKNSNFDVCIIKVDALGDYILCLDSLYNISLKYKKKRSIFVCNQIIYELAIKVDFFNEIYPIDIEKFRKDYFYRFLHLRKLKRLKANISLQPTYSRETITGDSIIRAISSKFKIGHFGDYTNQSKFLKKISNKWYTNLFSFKTRIIIHELEINKKFLHFLEINKIKKYEIKKLSNFEKIKFDFHENYLVITPGASDHYRTWSVDKFISLIEYIFSKSNYFIILCGSKNDIKISNKIKQTISNNKLIDYTGKTTILDFIEIIRFSKFVVGNDSASIHIAYSLKVKSFSLSGGNTFNRFVPYSYTNDFSYKPKTIYHDRCYENNWNCCKQNQCINMITLDKVVQIIDKYI